MSIATIALLFYFKAPWWLFFITFIDMFFNFIFFLALEDKIKRRVQFDCEQFLNVGMKFPNRIYALKRRSDQPRDYYDDNN